jgi:hypothetical protein
MHVIKGLCSINYYSKFLFQQPLQKEWPHCVETYELSKQNELNYVPLLWVNSYFLKIPLEAKLLS